ncbi:pre-peptidase C-terminal domain-containing protein [Deinococcus taeanensis]|uniref:Ig-like domain-containing protein n=1 Tax=Deinococcus taeanensis TaxID=2737050 RepID=UPI001CDD50E4|nr:Ig-like domain-containing protein [Deinococcus taeanensis]UBV42293.1 pre-peptidase C-terminal domain-containing protein [Deinococcus taeanensis]
MKRTGPFLFLALTGALLTACTPHRTPDATKPAVTLTAAPTTVNASRAITLTATATDNVGVSQVAFYRGTTLISTDTTAPYTATDNVTSAQNGTLTYRAVASDAAGNTAEASATVTVAIADANEPNDSVATATTLAIGGTANGAITAQGRDMDYFKFTATTGDMLQLNVRSVSVNPSSTLDPYVTILMPDGKTILEKDDDSGAGLESEIRFNVPQSGTYTVVVTSFNIHDDPVATDDKATNTYQIALSRR